MSLFSHNVSVAKRRGDSMPREFREGIRARLKLVRESLGLDQEEMAKELGVNRETYAKWETRPSSTIPMHLVPKVVEISGYELWWFMTGKAPSTDPSRRTA